MATAAPSRAKRGAPRQVVFSFDEGAPKTRTPAVRGGKGAHLADMTALGLPVPPGFTVTTTVARAFQQNNRLPNRMVDQFIRCLDKLERQTGKEFGNPENPLLVSVRSGAQASMPGMMDTVLNVGLNPSTVAGLARLQGKQFALDAYCRFLVQFGATVLGVSPQRLEYVISSTKAQANEGQIETLGKTCERLRLAIEFDTMMPIPDDVMSQLELSVYAVLRSWQSERAIAYRRANNLPSWWGTATTVQAMVFGNRSDASGTGVVFSHNVTTGQPGLYGEFLPKAQGEDIVAGTHDPLPISALAEWNPSVYQDLKRLVALLVDHIGDMVDVEFTIEDGELYLLQVRPAKRTSLASVTYAVHQVWAEHMTREQALASVSAEDINHLQRSEFATAADQLPLFGGLAASPGAAVGQVVTSSAQAIEWADRGEKVILVVRDTTPSDLPGMLRAQALVTSNGGLTCHAAVVAREQGLPAVVGVGETRISQLTEGQFVSVDGTLGSVYDGTLSFTDATLTKEADIFLRWHKRFVAYQPRIGFEWRTTQQCVNQLLNDFYLSDLMATVSKGSALESTASQLKAKVHQNAAEFIAAYLAIAVGGEIRYAFTKLAGDYPAELNLLKQRFGAASYSYNEREAAQTSVLETLENASVTDQVEFFRLCWQVFDCGKWIISGYGGSAWGNIAHAGHQFLSGAWTPTVFVDHVFDLRHNGGSLFDKHPMVSRLTRDSDIFYQLDAKKQARTVTGLLDSLRYYASFSRHVVDLFEEGVKAHIW